MDFDFTDEKTQLSDTVRRWIEKDYGFETRKRIVYLEHGVSADYSCVLPCAETVDTMEALSAATLEYLKTRQQFGVSIGKFQALQRRMADMFMHQAAVDDRTDS